MPRSRVRIRQNSTGTFWYVEVRELGMWLCERACRTQEEANEWALTVKENLEHPKEYEI
jgi:hypothetical protein